MRGEGDRREKESRRSGKRGLGGGEYVKGDGGRLRGREGC